MFSNSIETTIQNLYIYLMSNLEEYLPKIIGALMIIGIGAILTSLTYKLFIYLFKRFRIVELVDKFSHQAEKIIKNQKIEEKEKLKKIKHNIKYDKIIAKAASYYIFLIFFRLAIVAIGIEEIEVFLGDLLTYLPSLFIAAVIAFFGIRFANFTHDIAYHTLKISKQKNAKVIANGIKILVLFFTLMVVLDRVGIAADITRTIFIGFTAMISIAGGLAFGLGGKDLAHDILEGFKK